MRVGRILSIVVVSLASVIVIVAGAIAIVFFAHLLPRSNKISRLPTGNQAISSVGNTVLFSRTSGNSSSLYRKNPSDGSSVRLTSA